MKTDKARKPPVLPTKGVFHMSHMNKSSLSAAAGLAATAAAVGAAAYVMNARSMKGQRKAIKKTAAKAGRVMTDVVNGVVDSMADLILG